jgi:Asp-tRNA(Asn)/Glu-tRNA(Gln) amidotransferase A subunit family amidase
VNAGWVEATGEIKLPFGVTLLGGSGMDGKVLGISEVFEEVVKKHGLQDKSL